MAFRVRDALPAAGVSLAGLALLAGLMLAPRPGAPLLGVVFPPWMDRGAALAHAAALALPIADIRWHGRLVVIAPPAADPGRWRAALPPGSLVIAATGLFCAPAATSDTPFPASGPDR